MKASFVLLALALVCGVFAQTREDLQFVDDYSASAGPILIIIQSDSVFPLSDALFTEDSVGVIGGERDLQMVVESGVEGRLLSTGVNNGEWTVSVAQDSRGYALIQYDGVDGQIALGDVNVNGLNCYDITIGGQGDSFRLIIETDIETEYDFTIYDNQNRESFNTLTIPGDDTAREYFLFFDDFSGTADFTCVGAIEVLIEAFDNVDTIIDAFFINGPVLETPSPIPVPSTTPEPSPDGGFTWYTFDDDDNGRSPCPDDPERRTYFLDDNAVVYYYFYGFDYTYVSSSATSLVAGTCFAVIAALFAAVF